MKKRIFGAIRLYYHYMCLMIVITAVGLWTGYGVFFFYSHYISQQKFKKSSQCVIHRLGKGGKREVISRVLFYPLPTVLMWPCQEEGTFHANTNIHSERVRSQEKSCASALWCFIQQHRLLSTRSAPSSSSIFLSTFYIYLFIFRPEILVMANKPENLATFESHTPPFCEWRFFIFLVWPAVFSWLTKLLLPILNQRA